MNLNKKRIFLFDMDGTLIKDDQPFPWTLESALKDLMQYGELGIVSGTDLDTIQNKLDKFLNYSSTRYHLHVLPCNGTKWFAPPEFSQKSLHRRYSISMEQFMGKNDFQKLMKILVDHQSIATDDENISLKGSFILNRGSIVNWCPIGHSASSEDRNMFEDYDNKIKFRESLLANLRKSIALTQFSKKLDVKLAGRTSFDIFPTNWNKTFAMSHFPDFEVWFVGDSCRANGNDKEIYEACSDRAYETTGPHATADIIYDIIDRIDPEE